MSDQNKKSILLVGWFFYPRLGGVESIMLNQARELIKLGYDVSVLTSLGEGLKENEVFERINIYRRTYIDSGKSYSQELIYNDLEKICSLHKFRLAHFHNGSYPAASNDMVAGGKNIINILNFFAEKRIVLIDHAHNAQLKNPEHTKQLRELPWDCIIAVSDFVKDEWKKLGFSAKRMTRIYNGIDVAKFSEATASRNFSQKGEIVILFPARVISMSQGRISKQKNFSLLVEACDTLLEDYKNKFKLVAILNESLARKNTQEGYGELKEITKELEIADSIEFVNEVSNDEMPGLYASSDIVCVPSFNETFGLVYLEAMASGKIAISSNTGGPKEYIKSGENGYLVDPENSNDLAKKLTEVIDSRHIRQTISEKARETAQDFSFAEFMKNILELYKQFGN